MHWTALGFGLGIAAYFGVSREPGAAVFWAVSLSAGLCAVLAVRLRNGIARLLIVIAVVAAGFSWSQYRAYSVAGPVCWSGFMARYRGGSLASIAACRKSHALLWTNWCWAPCRSTSRRAGCAWHCMEEHKSLNAPDWRYRAAGGAFVAPPGPAEPHGYDFQRQAWFARLGAVGYTRSPVMLWRAAPVNVTG